MVEALRRLRFGRLEDYHYIGLGSVYFADFALFHRALGIRRMTSIEQEEHDKSRFSSNLPYANIKMAWGSTSEVLPQMDLSSRAVVWLDYDGSLDRSMLDDLRTVASKAATGSVLALSVQCQPPRQDLSAPRNAVNELARKLGADRIDPQWSDEDLAGWGSARVAKKIFQNELTKILQQRNGTLQPGQRFQAEQIFNFHYNDGANMLTVGWIIFDEGQRPIFNSCNFDGLDFVRSSDEEFKIEIPKLTSIELKRLSTQLPLEDGAEIQNGPIPISDATNFVKIYRFFPNVAFVDI